jgi:caffeoyl-CoA O-methyltransferase
VFSDLPPAMAARMRALEEIDGRDRSDGTPQARRLRQIPPETGRFLALLATMAPAGAVVEIGTSAGYSALWLSLACRLTERRLTTFEVDPAKVALAAETFALAGVGDVVDQVEGDVRDDPDALGPVGFCFLDAEKEVYPGCYEAVVERLVPGGILVADNVISHEVQLAPFVAAVLADERVDAVVVPIGKGELLCRRR